MKFLRLIKLDMKHYLFKDPGSLFVVLLTLFCCFFALMCFTGVTGAVSQGASTAARVTALAVYPEESVTAAQVARLFEDAPLGPMNNAYMLMLGTSPENPNIFGWKGTAFTRIHALEPNKDFLTEEEIESEEDVLIMNSDMIAARRENMLLNDVTYRVSSQQSLSPYLFFRFFESKPENYLGGFATQELVIMPYKTFVRHGYTPQAIVLDLKTQYNGDLENARRIISGYFPVRDVFMTISATQTTAAEQSDAYLQIIMIGMSLLSLSGILQIYRGWLRQSGRQIRTFCLCGATPRGIMAVLFIEWVLITLFAGILAYGALRVFAVLYGYFGRSIVFRLSHFAAIVGGVSALVYAASTDLIVRLSVYWADREVLG